MVLLIELKLTDCIHVDRAGTWCLFLCLCCCYIGSNYDTKSCLLCCDRLQFVGMDMYVAQIYSISNTFIGLSWIDIFVFLFLDKGILKNIPASIYFCISCPDFLHL